MHYNAEYKRETNRNAIQQADRRWSKIYRLNSIVVYSLKSIDDKWGQQPQALELFMFHRSLQEFVSDLE